jgi:hypothetical protein
MRKRLLLGLGLLALVLLGGYLVLWLTAPSHRITAEAAAKIRAGMTEQQVEGLLGGLAGVYVTTTVVFVYPNSEGTGSTIWFCTASPGDPPGSPERSRGG